MSNVATRRVPRTTKNAAPADPPIVADYVSPPAMTLWLDPIFEIIDLHRQTYAALDKAEDDYNADPEEREEGPIADRLHEAVDGGRQVFSMLLATKPRTHEGLCALIAHVYEIARRQNAKGHHDDGPRDLVERLRGVIAIRGARLVYA